MFVPAPLEISVSPLQYLTVSIFFSPGRLISVIVLVSTRDGDGKKWPENDSTQLAYCEMFAKETERTR